MTATMEKKINPTRWREEVADFTTGVERVGNTVYVFYLVEGDGLAVRVLGNPTVHLYDATNTRTADTMTAPTWALANEQWAEVRRLFDAGQVEEAKHLADKLVILEAIEADEAGEGEEELTCALAADARAGRGQYTQDGDHVPYIETKTPSVP